jgi:hypothetical protein
MPFAVGRGGKLGVCWKSKLDERGWNCCGCDRGVADFARFCGGDALAGRGT